jgi:KaiC/GvpD/RAD55 family RecA-like ATPase
MVIPTGLEELNGLLKGGYPERSSILIVGPPGIGKEAIGYWFIHSGLSSSDFCLYVTRLAVSEVLQDMRAFHVDLANSPIWIASEGAQTKCDITDLSSLSVNIKEALRRDGEGSIRIVADILSPLLMLNPSETIYRFLSQLLTDIKQRKAVFLATIEEGMHQPQVLAAMEQLFDGVLELKLFEEGLHVMPLLRIRKMRGMPPEPGYFRFSFSQGKMEVSAYVR